MKKLMLVVLSVVCGSAHAKSMTNLERDTASSKPMSHLGLAFQAAVKGSDADLKTTTSTVVVEEKERMAKWSSYGDNKKAIVIPASAAVDSSTINQEPKIIVRESQVETDSTIKKELTELQ